MNQKPDKGGTPAHLEAKGAALWRYVLGDFDLEQHHREILLLACEALDRCEQARAVIAEQGMTYDDRFGQPRARPEVAIERDSRIAVSRLIRELGLDVEGTAGTGTPVITPHANLRKAIGG